jgi:hypothetical protein
MKTNIMTCTSNKSIARVPNVNILYEEAFIGFKPSEHQGVLLGDWFPTIQKIEMPSSARLDLDEKGTTTCRSIGDQSPNDISNNPDLNH